MNRNRNFIQERKIRGGNQMTEKSGEAGKKVKLNGDMLSFLVVAGIVLGLVGTAFFISRPREEKQGEIDVISNEDLVNKNVVAESKEGKEAVIKSKETYIDGRFYSQTKYDEDGNEIYYSYVSEDGSWSEHYYEYDENGNEISSHYIDYYSDGEIQNESWTVDIYDENGKCLGYKSEEANGNWDEVIYTYDDKSRVTSHLSKSYYTNLDECYYLYYTISYKEDNNRVIEETTYYDYDKSTGEFKASEYIDYTELVYDGKGNIVEESSKNTYYLLEGESYTKYEYDKVGNVLYEYCISKRWGEFNYEYESNYEYNTELNRCIKYITTGQSAMYEDKYGGMEYTHITTYEYDSKGNLIEETQITTYFNGESDEKCYSYVYTYYE